MQIKLWYLKQDQIVYVNFKESFEVYSKQNKTNR